MNQILMKRTQVSIFTIVILLLSGSLTACKKKMPVSPGNDPNFKIEANEDAEFSRFNRKVEVFGINIYAVKKVDDDRLLHAANVLAQYLDNDEDGAVDNPDVWNAMVNNGAYLVMWKKQSDLNRISPPADAIGQDLGNDETIPDWHSNGQTGRFDASLEEVWHLVTHAGYEQAYPNVFGTAKGTSMSDAMDVARGGVFDSPPQSYPESAWYTYDDPTCDYNCQGGEYIYWVLTSMLGAQENRASEIGNEWELHTRALVEEKDPVAYELLTDPQYKFPTRLPDGTYQR